MQLCLICISSQDNRISLVDYVVSYYLHNVDEVLNALQMTYCCCVVCFTLHEAEYVEKWLSVLSKTTGLEYID